MEANVANQNESAAAQQAHGESTTQGAQEDAHNNEGQLIHFKVDGEECTTLERVLTANFIIEHFGGGDPLTSYLVRIQGHDKVSYQDHGNEPIEIHNGWRFQVISVGPTPVSDGGFLVGVERFSAELRQLGYQVQSLPDQSDHVVIDYEIETGKFAGKQIQLGLIVPTDFPLSCPTGPMISPCLRPIIADAPSTHPTGAIHLAQAEPFRKALSGEWQYWSRPFRDWQKSKRTVAAYLSHVWHLMDTQ